MPPWKQQAPSLNEEILVLSNGEVSSFLVYIPINTYSLIFGYVPQMTVRSMPNATISFLEYIVFFLSFTDYIFQDLVRDLGMTVGLKINCLSVKFKPSFLASPSWNNLMVPAISKPGSTIGNPEQETELRCCWISKSTLPFDIVSNWHRLRNPSFSKLWIFYRYL